MVPLLRRIPLRRKLLSLLLLASALPLAVAIGTMFVRARSLLRSDAIALLATRADQLATELEGFHATHGGVAARLATFPITRRFLGAERRVELEEMNETLVVYLHSDRRLRNVAILSREGLVLATSDPLGRGVDLSMRPFVKAALAGNSSISNVHIAVGVPEPSPVIAYASPVRGAAREVVGVAVVYVHASAFWELVRQANGRAGAGSFSVVYDRHGVRIAHSFNDNELFRPAGPLPQALKAELVAEARFGEETQRLLSSPSAMPEEMARVLGDPPEGEQAFQGYSPANGAINLGVTKKLRTVPWTLFCLVPETSLQVPVNRLAAWTAASGGLLVLLALVVGLVLSSGIILPLRRLVAAAEALRAGKLDARVTPETTDEIGALGTAFNEMADALSEAQGSLEQRVKERTLALEKANEELQLQTNELQAQKDELRRQQEELQSKSAELARADRLKSEFLANMSHELRTPLNAIIGFSELLMQGPVESSETGRQYLEHVLDSGRHLLALINDILDLSKIEAGAAPFHPERCDPALALESACTMLQASARRKQVQLVQRPGDAPSVHADPGKLRQILLNLLSNAIKFSPEGATVEVGIEESRAGAGLVRFVVADQGPGIAEQLLPRLFEPFVQGEDPMVKKHQGTGLGLAITRRLVELHGGRIAVESNHPRGTRFCFTIPVSVEEGARPGADRARRLVLLVDSERATAAALASRFEKEGYRVATFDNGRDVATVAAELAPVAIILDPASERRDGLLVMDTLARWEATRDIPVIISGLPGATNLVAKPLETQRLLRTLERLVTRAEDAIPTVLSIDDDPRVHELLRATLAPAGYRVRTSVHPVEGLAAALAEPPDLVVVDLVMPEMSGFEVIEKLAADPRTRAVPVVVLTAAELTDDERTRLRRQVRAIAEKGNVTEEELLAAVNAASRRAERPRRAMVHVPGRQTILVVDDNDTNRALARALLERRGFRVLDAEGGEAGLELASRERPALIFMDLAMPGKDGYAAARALKSAPLTAEVPIVALTALAMSGDEQRARSAGIDDYLTKPIDQEKLDALLARFLPADDGG